MTAQDAVLLRGGTVVTESGERMRADVRVVGGRIAEIAPGLEPRGERVLDCEGLLVSPALIDMHVHVYEGATSIGLNTRDAAFTRGVLACVDAGSAGASSFEGFRRFIVETSPIRVLSYLNVSVLGLVDIRHGELKDPSALRPDEVIEVVASAPDVIRGLKVRLSHNVVGAEPLDILDRALELAATTGLRLMVHVGNTTCSLGEIVGRLRAGDIVTHVYTGNENGILDENQQILPEVLDARARGVLFEIGHGRTQMNYDVARVALAAGFTPDLIGSDISNGNWQGPSFDLATVGSKLIALGMDADAVLAAMTSAPAKILGVEDEGFGALRVGATAKITVLDEREDFDDVPDAVGSTLRVSRLDPLFTVDGTTVTETVPWRGYAAAAMAAV